MPAFNLAGFTPVISTLSTTLANFGGTPGTGKERTLKVLRATNITATDQTISITVAGGYVAFNILVPAGGSQDLIDDSFGPILGTEQMQARASAAASISLQMRGYDRTIS